jgi:azobenzene reductase
MKIVGFNGSLSSSSNTYLGVKAVLEAAAKQGAETILFDLREKPLPIYLPDDEGVADENVKEWNRVMLQADGIVLGSPEYHNGVSGAFKNALDWIGSNHFKNKPVALVAASGGPVATSTLSSMQTMVRSLHGWVVPIMGSVSGSVKFGPGGTCLDTSMCQRFQAMGYEVTDMAKRLKGKRGDAE